MNLARHEVSLGKHEVPLTAKEFGLLEHLLRHRAVLTQKCCSTPCGATTTTEQPEQSMCISAAQAKLPLLEEAIVSVKSLGYKLRDLY